MRIPTVVLGVTAAALAVICAIFWRELKFEPEVPQLGRQLADQEPAGLEEAKADRASTPRSVDRQQGNAAITPTNGPPPPPLGPEFDPILNRIARMKEMHELFVREPREESWAPLMEGRWNTAFAGNPELLAYGTPTVHCRTTRCEIQLVTYQQSELNSSGWFQLIITGAGRRDPGDQSVPLVTGIRNSLPVAFEKDGTTVILLSYEYQR